MSKWVIIFSFLPFLANGNAAPPGFWGAGHGSTIIPLFNSDSTAISKVQMQRELIFVDLYKNYAVVKGVYWFFNHSNKQEKIRTGYPVNGENYAYGVDMVRFDDLHHIRAVANGKNILPQRLSEYMEMAKGSSEVVNPSGLTQIGNWFVWDMLFDPMTTTKLEVYFIVHTPSTLTQGYGRKEANAFEYILQTGSSWKDRIMQGNIIVSLKDGLSIDEIMGVYPLQNVSYSGQQLLYQFTNLKPKAEDDLIIWYKGDTSTSFGPMLPDVLYKQIDQTDTAILHRSGLVKLEKSDFDTPTPGWSYLLWAFGILAVLIGLSIIAGIIYIIYKFIKKIIHKK